MDTCPYKNMLEKYSMLMIYNMHEVLHSKSYFIFMMHIILPYFLT